MCHTPPVRPSVQAVLALALGAAVILALFGWQVVPPWRTGWMLSGQVGPDPVQYWLGYAFFREDSWRWPPGLSPRWGLEIGSSVFYADSIPLLAFLFKALWPVVPVDQYWGMWLVACGALNAFLGWRIMGLYTESALARLALGGLCALQPILINRLGGHFALGAQFLLLAGLYLVLRPRERGGARVAEWLALVLATSLIHSYLLPMVLALWLADWLAAWPGRSRVRALAEAVAAPAAGLFGLYLAGFFALRGGHGGGGAVYGGMQLDLLSPFDPAPWGGILPNLPDPGHLETGGSYPGLGVLLLWLAALALGWRSVGPALRRRWPLALVLGLMLAFAFTHRPTVGGVRVELIPLPEAVVELAGALRASERFFWPLAYALIAASGAVLARRLGPRRAGLALAALFAVQVADFGPGAARVAHFFPRDTQAQVPLRLADPFWAEAAQRYQRVRLVPARNQGFPWEEVAVFAATKGLETDAIYLARADPEAMARLNADTLERLRAGDHEPGTLYVFRDEPSLALALRGMDGRRDFLAEFDGIWALAPGWWRR